MKIHKQTSLGVIIYFLTLLYYNSLFSIVPLNVDRINVITIVLAAGILLTGSYHRINSKQPECLFLFCFFALFFVQVIFSSIRYSQSIFDSLFAEKYYFILLLYYILSKVFISNRDYTTVIDMLVIVGCISAVLYNLQVLVLHDMGIEFMIIEYGKRLDGVRVVNGTNTIEFASFLAAGMLLNKTEKSNGKRLLYIFTLVSTFIYVVFVAKTRMMLLIFALTLGFLVIFRSVASSRTVLAKRFGAFLAISVLFCYLYNTNYVRKLVSDFNVTSVSVGLRMQEIMMYTNQLLQDPISFLIGTGMIHDTNHAYYLSVLGPNGIGGRTDVGLIGFIHQFGLMGLILYIWFLVIMIRTISSLRAKEIPCLELVAFTVVFILGSGTLCMFNRGRIIGIPLMLYMVSYYRNLLRTEEDDKYVF